MKPLVKPHGIGDLLVVKQNLLGYRRAALADIRNVMAGEIREARNRRLRRQERSRISRLEREDETLRELQATERFELAQESQKTIMSETSFGAGAEVSANYGPVSASAYFDFSTTDSETESNRNATTYAREVVERSVKRIIEKTFEEQADTLIEEFEESDLHRFENQAGENKTGLYFWLDKILRLKVVNYGKRVFYKFVVPEPAAFFVMSRTMQNQEELPEEPAYPRVNGQRLKPTHITRNRWRWLAAKVEAQGVKPPPPRTRYVTKHIVREFKDLTSHFTISPSQIDVPKGYVADRIDGAQLWWWTERRGVEEADTNFDLDLIVGKTSKDREADATENSEVSPSAVEGDVGSIPIGVQFDAFPQDQCGTFSVYAAVRIKCRLEAQTFQKWQMETYDAIITAYNNKKAEYEERLAQAQVRGGYRIAGRHPDINRATELTELKKACITMWTGFTYNGLPGIRHNPTANSPNNLPEIEIENALELAPEIELMENGFEWENATYKFVPYYWARKRNWLDMQTHEDPDPLFQSFLQAGAAIVMVPVRPEFTKTILYYQLTGTFSPDEEVPIFHTGEPGLTLTADTGTDNRDEELALYHSYVAEIEAQATLNNLDRDIVIDPDDPDAWEVAIPVPMAYLDPSMELPEPEADA